MDYDIATPTLSEQGSNRLVWAGRRMPVLATIRDKGVVHTLFEDIAPVLGNFVCGLSGRRLKLEEGDLLITDASDGAIKSGQTSASILARAKDRGADIYSLPGLHAKLESPRQQVRQAAAIVERDHVGQRLLRSIVHVRPGQRDVAQGWRLEPAGIPRVLRDRLATDVGMCFLQGRHDVSPEARGVVVVRVER